MVTVVSIFLSAALLVAMACRDLVKRYRKLYHVTIWAGAVVLGVLIWTNPEYFGSARYAFP